MHFLHDLFFIEVNTDMVSASAPAVYKEVEFQRAF